MSSVEKYNFQAEIQQLLDIVINSLYSDREIFIRELISNAADACEKVRFLQAAGHQIQEPDKPLSIEITTNEAGGIFTIADTGVGMTHTELVNNLGTIARSGTKAFLQQIQANAQGKDKDLIGKFGVGFYSAFMVAKRITVYTKSYKPEEPGWKWISEGAGGFEIEPAENLSRGTKVVIELKDDAKEFSKSLIVEPIIKKYSNFVQFPIELNGKRLNVIQAIWARNKNEIKEEEYTEFYRYISHDYEPPLMRLHFTADAPISIQALLFVPSVNIEAIGFGRFEPSVSLYCKKILVQQHSDKILPEWLRFLKGVVDSEDLPLNISREFTQDSALLTKLNRIITKRFIKHLEETAEKDKATYEKFYLQFHRFIKEGIINDLDNKDALANLMRFESSALEPGKLTSLKEYLGRKPQDQKEIYYLLAQNRTTAENSPFFESARANKTEVLFLYDVWDEYVMETLRQFEGCQIRSLEKTELELRENVKKENALPQDKAQELAKWIKETLKDRVNQVKVSRRLVDSPAIAVDNDTFISASMYRYIRAVSPNKNITDHIVPDLEINPAHPLIIKLESLRGSNPELAKRLSEHILDVACLTGGLVDDVQPILKRIEELLELTLK